ncbi:MAG TPA: hypothetical protein VHL53_08545, partial [Acidimicrobiia bacterium]|nr:hypothetical protein [Acidimicrobiia bacterium]
PTFELRDDDTVVIHMGAGARRDVVRAAIRNYHAYEGIQDRAGAFTVSVFAALGDITALEIVAALPQRQYGIARYGDLRGRFELWPTTITGTAVPDRVMAVHFDVVLPDEGFQLPAGTVIEDLDDDALAAIDELLGPAVEDLLPCFLPRRTK